MHVTQSNVAKGRFAPDMVAQATCSMIQISIKRRPPRPPVLLEFLFSNLKRYFRALFDTSNLKARLHSARIHTRRPPFSNPLALI